MTKSLIKPGTESIALACADAGDKPLGGLLAACSLCVVLTLAAPLALQLACAQSAPVGAGVRLEAGMEKEDVDGDLQAAMDIYAKVASDTSAPRDVRARALLRLAGCERS